MWWQAIEAESGGRRPPSLAAHWQLTLTGLAVRPCAQASANCRYKQSATARRTVGHPRAIASDMLLTIEIGHPLVAELARDCSRSNYEGQARGEKGGEAV